MDVENEAATEDLLHRRTESVDAGSPVATAGLTWNYLKPVCNCLMVEAQLEPLVHGLDQLLDMIGIGGEIRSANPRT